MSDVSSPRLAGKRRRFLVAIEVVLILAMSYFTVVMWSIAGGPPIEPDGSSHTTDVLIAVGGLVVTLLLITLLVWTWRRASMRGPKSGQIDQ